MRICIFAHTFPRFQGDTAAPFMGELAEALAGTNNEITVLIPYDTRIDFRVKRPYKLLTYRYIFPDNLHRLGFSRTLHGDKELKTETYLLAPFMFFFGFLSLLRLARREKIDVISAHWIIPNGFVAALVSKLTDIPFTVTIPGSDVYLGGKNQLFRFMVGIAAQAARFVISDSSHYLKQLMDLGFKPKSTVIVRYGVNTKKFSVTGKAASLLRIYNLDKDTPIILAVGRMVEKKGFRYLIAAMPSVVKKIPQAKFLMVGDGEQRQELEEMVESLGIEQSVIFAGTISYSELSKYYNLADVFVMPSIKDESGNIDASPVAMMEAMSCGTPVVATKFSGSQDLTGKGKTGFLVGEKDSKQIADSVIKLLRTHDKNKMRKEVRHVAEKNFSTKSVAQKYIKIFRECLEF